MVIHPLPRLSVQSELPSGHLPGDLCTMGENRRHYHLGHFYFGPLCSWDCLHSPLLFRHGERQPLSVASVVWFPSGFTVLHQCPVQRARYQGTGGQLYVNSEHGYTNPLGFG